MKLIITVVVTYTLGAVVGFFAGAFGTARTLAPAGVVGTIFDDGSYNAQQLADRDAPKSGTKLLMVKPRGA